MGRRLQTIHAAGSRARRRGLLRRRALRHESLEHRMVLAAMPVLSEFMAINDSVLADEDGQFRDWLEIHNQGTDPVNLDGWYLTDDENDLDRWQFPSVDLPAGDFLVVFASDKNRAVAGSQLHTNFKLSGAGESLLLVEPDGATIASQFANYPEQLADVSYGVIGAGPQQYFVTPTPGAANTPGTLGFVADTKFSVDRGFYSAPFQVEITSATPDSSIRYTTDGTPPTATRGTLYTSPIPVTTTTVLRAIAYKAGFEPTNVDTQTYIFAADVLSQDGSGLPPSENWGHAGPDWEVDPTIVNLSGRSTDKLLAEDLQAIPSISLVMNWVDMFGDPATSRTEGIYTAGEGIEKATSFEFIDPATGQHVQANAEVHVRGGSSINRWKTDKLSMRVQFEREFGPTKLDFPLFGDEATDRFDTIELDGQLNYVWAYGNNSSQRRQATYVHDQFVADIHNELGGDSPHGRFAHLYINGVYWGMYYLHERPDESFAAAQLGGDKDHYDAINQGRSIHDGLNPDGSAVPAKNAERNLSAMLSAADAAGNGLEQWNTLESMLDVDHFIRYLLANWYTGNGDWGFNKNWYATHENSPEGRWRFHSWDAEKALVSVSRNDVGTSPKDLHDRLRDSAEYRIRFADEIHRTMFNGGLLTPEGILPLFQRRIDEIDRAIAAESARWGDNRTGGGEPSEYRRSHWVANIDNLLNSFFPNRTDIVLNQFRNASLYPSLDAPAFNQHGGLVPIGFDVTMNSPGDVYYTLNGSDPRLPGGAIHPDALLLDGSVTINASTKLLARTLRGSTWSALSAAQFFVDNPADATNLAVTEINYNPHDPTPAELAIDPTFTAGDFEFVELQNTSGATIDLTGVSFVDGITFTFSAGAGSALAPGERTVIVKNASALEARYGTEPDVAGLFAGGSLSNGGELVGILDRDGEPIAQFTYNDSGSWPGRADGNGSSLEIIDTAGDYNDSENWRASTEYGGSPGAAGMGAYADVIVNEVLTRTSEGTLDAIELYNPTDADVSIAGWFLSDSNDNYFKFTFGPGTTIPAGTYRVFDESHFNPTPGVGDSFALDGTHGDDVWLLAADAATGKPARFADRVEFGAAELGVSLGRWPNGSGGLFPMTEYTPGTANRGPRIGPVIISEVMYNPTAAAGDEDLEFVELHNPTAAEVSLGGWRLAGAVEMQLPAGTMLSSGGTLVAVHFDPNDGVKATAFRAHYGIDDDVDLIGPFSGALNNAGERLQLLRPGAPPPDEPLFTPMLLIDEVNYDDTGPWPTSADGTGDSLTRLGANLFGNLATSWNGDAPTPGDVRFTPTQPGDTDGDGDVDIADLNNVRNNFGGAGLGDTNGDGVVDISDLNAVRNNFGAAANVQAAAAPDNRLSSRQALQETAVATARHSLRERIAMLRSARGHLLRARAARLHWDAAVVDLASESPVRFRRP